MQLESHDRGVILPVRARAGARQNAVVGIRNGMLRIAVTAPPEKGRANQAIIALLSQTLGWQKSAIELVSGQTSPRKRFLFHGATADEVAAAIEKVRLEKN